MQGDYFLIFWHQRDSIENGWDLIWAANAQQARLRYQAEHHAPIHRILSRTWDEHIAKKEAAQHPGSTWQYYSYFESISPRELNRARAGEVVEIEAGT